jgi:LuxR family maltose regulon positive regulatory protein
LTAVVAPAGYGKTVLAASWIRAGRAPGPVAWLNLRREDNHPAVFWPYLIEALRPHLSGAGTYESAPVDGHPLSRRALAWLSADLSGLARPVVLVLDGTEVLANRSVLSDLDLLLRYSTPGLRLIVIGRRVRVLPLHRYRLTGELTEIGADALALQPDETAAILARHRLRLTDAETARLHDRYEGWVAGICLQAIAQQGREPGSASASGHRAVTDYLRAEVLNALPARFRSFLLHTRIVDDLDPGLAERLSGRPDARKILDELVRENAFVRPIDESSYHLWPPFREALRNDVTAEHPVSTGRLHRIAANWYCQHNRIPEALHHAVRIADWNYAACLAICRLGVARLLTAPDAEQVRTLFSALPDDQAGTPASLIRAVLALADADPGTARVELDRTRRRLDTDTGNRTLLLQVGVAAAGVVLGRLTGDVDRAAREAAEADRVVARMSPRETIHQRQTLSLIQSSLGSALLWAGRVEAARAALARAAADPDGGYAAHDALGHLAMIELLDGRLHRAERYARDSIAAAELAELRAGARAGAASVTLATVALIWNDLSAVREHMSRAIATVSSRHDPPTATALALLRAHIASAHGDGPRALAALDTARAGAGHWRVPPSAAGLIELAAADVHLQFGNAAAARACVLALADGDERTLALARVHALEGDPVASRHLLDQLQPPAARPATLLHAALLRARLAVDDGDTETARRALREALEYARPEQRRRPFADAGPWVRRLLREHPDLAAEHPWLFTHFMPAPGEHTRNAAPESLTRREREVLQGLTQGLSVADIAGELRLSVNTIKTHLKNIYRKLGTNDRSSTARRARQLRLVKDTGTPGRR